AVADPGRRFGEALERILLGVGRLGLEALARILRIGEGPQHGLAVALRLSLGFGELLLERLFCRRGAFPLIVVLNGLLLHLVELGTDGRHFKRPASITTY